MDSLSIEESIKYKLSTDSGHYIFIPSKLKEYNDFLVTELSTIHEINKDIISVINKNIDVYLLNFNKEIFNYIEKNNQYIRFIKLPNKEIYFENITLNIIDKLLKYNNFVESNINIINDYYDFVNFIFFLYKNKCNLLVSVIKSNLDKLMVISYKINKIFNYVDFLKEEKNRNIVFDFIYKNKVNKILLDYYEEIKILDLHFNECIPHFFSRYDLRKVIFNHYNSKNNNFNTHDYALYAKIKKQSELSFIFKILSYSKESIEKIKKEEITIELLKDKLNLEYYLVNNFIDTIKMIEFEIYKLKFNINYYADRQRIIHKYSHYLKILFNNFKNKTTKELTLDVFHNIIINDKNNSLIIFFLNIIKTDSDKLIYL